MQIRFRPVFVALTSLFAVKAALAQAPAAKPAAKPPAEAPTAAPPAAADAPVEEPAEAAEGAEPSAAEPAAPDPAATRALPPPQVNPLPAFPDPGTDAAALQQVGRDRPAPARPKEDIDVYADDWWSHARPVLEIHGAFRVRSEMFYRFHLDRVDPADQAIWPRPPDSPYVPRGGSPGGLTKLCTAKEADRGSNTDATNSFECESNLQLGANLRFRLNPEVHVSDNLRVLSQIDLLDNVTLGSTPSGYFVVPSADGGYNVGGRSGYDPTSFGDQTTNAPRSGINSLSDSVHVKRIWAEYSTPVGELRFGRMPNHWGLGIVNHSGDGYDDDYQSTIDRIQFVAGIKPLDLYVSAAWDFPNEGANSTVIGSPSAQPYDLAQLDDVDQYVGSVVRKKSYELTKLALTRGEIVLNGGFQFTYRDQLLSTDCPNNASNCSTLVTSDSYSRRDAYYVLPDLWIQVLYKQFRFEMEGATVQGKIHNPTNAPNNENIDDTEYTIATWGFAGELEQRLVENRLQLGFNFGWSSGDADVDGLEPGTNGGTFGQIGQDMKISTFRFNPSYRNDMILFRNLLTRVQGAYYFRPSIGYDFVRDPTGQRLGGTFSGMWARASEFMQTPGHDHDLGIELNAALYFQSKDGALNDDPTRMGGFYARLEYGILFPMAGLGYPSGTKQQIRNDGIGSGDTANAQILRLYLGVMF